MNDHRPRPARDGLRPSSVVSSRMKRKTGRAPRPQGRRGTAASVPGRPATQNEANRARAETEKTVNVLLSDGFMILLAVLMVPIIILPLAIPELPADIVNFFQFCDIVILALFYLEYFLKLALARDRKKHFLDPWHLFDLVIILIPLFEFTPIFTWFGYDLGNKSPLLRLLRMARLFAVGSRTMKRQRVAVPAIADRGPATPPLIRALEVNLVSVRENIPLTDYKRMVTDRVPSWIDVSGISEEYIDALAQPLGIQGILLSSKLCEDSYPRIDHLEKHTLIYLIAARMEKEHDGLSTRLTMSRSGILIICSGTDIITMSRGQSPLFEKVLEETRRQARPGEPLTIAVLFTALRHVISGYRTILTEVEHELLRLENLRTDETPDDFLETTFQLKKDVSRLVSAMSHLKEIMSQIISKNVTLAGWDKNYEEVFDVLHDEAAYLHENSEDSKENLISIIDLHINKTSYELNKVMKVIAIFTVVAVIPTLVGGMLGMNVPGIPSGVILWQVIVFTALTMMGVSYIFVKLGWLKR